MKSIIPITIVVGLFAIVCILAPSVFYSLEPAVGEAAQEVEAPITIPEYHVISAEPVGNQIIFTVGPIM